MKAFRIFFLITVFTVTACDLAFSVFLSTEYLLAVGGKITPPVLNGLCYAVIALNGLCASLIPLYYYAKKKSFYQNRSRNVK